MATTTPTINATTNPTYGGYIEYDGVSSYIRSELNHDPEAATDVSTYTRRIFAFFDLSTDPTGGGTITKVELLATVNSVSGTHAVDICGGESSLAGGGGPGVDPAFLADENLYIESGGSGNYLQISTSTPSAGAWVVDLLNDGIAAVQNGISSNTGFFSGIKLSNEAAAGSVVFDAAAGFGLRITYTPAAGGSASAIVAAMQAIADDNLDHML